MAEQVRNDWWARNTARMLIALLALMAAIAFIAWQQNQSEDRADKASCERIYGAGNCVKSDGDWVPLGSRP